MDQKHRDKATAELLNDSLQFLSELDKVIAENTKRPDIEDLVFDEYQFACDGRYDLTSDHGDNWKENDPRVIEAFELYLNLFIINPAAAKAGTEWCWNCYHSEAGSKEHLNMCDDCWGKEPNEQKEVGETDPWFTNYMRDWGEDRTIFTSYTETRAGIVIVDGVRYMPSNYRGQMFTFK